MRNIENQVRQGEEIINKHSKAALRVSECMQLMEPIRSQEGAEQISDQIYDAIMNAFYMGVAVGARNA